MFMSQGSLELLKMLSEIDPRQPYGTELFDALARLTVSVAVEAVCLRPYWQIGSEIEQGQYPEFEVYLVQRAQDDTAYPGEWHCPGSVMRPMESIEDVMARLGKKEFGANLLSWKFVTNVNHAHEQRGHFFSLVYLCQLREEKEGMRGQWFPTYRLPQNTVGHHRQPIIPVALGDFLSDRTY